MCLVLNYSRMKNLFKNETVFCISVLAALFSMFIALPDAAYFNYPDYKTLALLFCLMIIVAAFKKIGIFDKLRNYLIFKASDLRSLALVLIMTCFFASMIITNDVALITFVPFTIYLLRSSNQKQSAKVIVLETIAANLGSMATPIGNPQNIYLTSIASLRMEEFFLMIAPYVLISLVLLWLFTLSIPKEKIQNTIVNNVNINCDYRLFISLLLLCVCILTVFKIIPYYIMLIAVILGTLLIDRRLFKEADYYLIATFVCFFIFVGNIKRMPEISFVLNSLVSNHEIMVGALLSQIISNVPAAILLSGFTENYTALLVGVNIGGLGTIIASLASLISFKFYGSACPKEKGRFIKNFTLYNVVFLLILLVLAYLLN